MSKQDRKAIRRLVRKLARANGVDPDRFVMPSAQLFAMMREPGGLPPAPRVPAWQNYAQASAIFLGAAIVDPRTGQRCGREFYRSGDTLSTEVEGQTQ